MGETILVTGGAGYVGSHVCKALAASGCLPICYDSLSNGHAWAVKWGPLERGSLGDRERLAGVIATHRPVTAIHLAGLIAVGESVSDPARYYTNNVSETLAFLETLKGNGIDQIVFSSSAAVYGNPDRVPIREDHPTRPTSPYGRTKLMVEEILADFAAAYGTQSVSLRYFNAAGADPDGEIGECHNPETHLIPLVLDAALGRRADISIFGNDYDTPDGSCVRDYVHVADLAEAHVLALRRLQTGMPAGAEVFNLGNGEGFSVREVIATAASVTGKQIPVRHAARRDGDPAILVSSSDRARNELGWRQQRAALDTQIADAWSWHCKCRAETGG